MRLTELFTFADEFCSKLLHDKIWKIYAPKVNIRLGNGQNIIGYVISEKGSKMKVKLMNNNCIFVSKIDYDKNIKGYAYETRSNEKVDFLTRSTEKIDWFCPIRMYIRECGEIKFVSSLIAETKKSTIVHQLCC